VGGNGRPKGFPTAPVPASWAIAEVDKVLGLTQEISSEDDAGSGEAQSAPPLLPDYGGACISSLSAALAARGEAEVPQWLPRVCVGARQVVLLVLDGIGWEQLQRGAALAPTLCSGEGGPVTSVVPTTTATALTSITTGLVPAEHGVVGYRLRVGWPAAHSTPGANRRGSLQSSSDEILNVLRWTTSHGDARCAIHPGRFQPVVAFGGSPATAVTRNEFSATGFTASHLGGTRLVGWSVPSTLVVEVRKLLRAGERFVYAYYDGLDKVAHAKGLGEHYSEELKAVDRLIGDLLEALPEEAALVVTSDHGQVEVGDAARQLDPAVFAHLQLVSGEGRFRWLHARPGEHVDLLEAAKEAHGDEAWVMTREQIVTDGWFGGPLRAEISSRLGDVALVARRAVAFLDPADTGETRLAARHGSLSAAEMQVPLLAWAAP